MELVFEICEILKSKKLTTFKMKPFLMFNNLSESAIAMS